MLFLLVAFCALEYMCTPMVLSCATPNSLNDNAQYFNNNSTRDGGFQKYALKNTVVVDRTPAACVC